MRQQLVTFRTLLFTQQTALASSLCWWTVEQNMDSSFAKIATNYLELKLIP